MKDMTKQAIAAAHHALTTPGATTNVVLAVVERAFVLLMTDADVSVKVRFAHHHQSKQAARLQQSIAATTSDAVEGQIQ